MNNKMITGSIAGATGVVLLMGGFGTYAVWSDSEDLTGDSITSGTLDVAAGAVSWTDTAATPNTLGDVTDWNLLMVPGDVVTRSQDFTFSGTGKNLKGAIVFAPGTDTEQNNAAGGGSAADSFTIDPTVDDGTLTEDLSGNCWEFTVANVGQTFETTVDFELTADNQDLQNVTATLDDATFTITQDATC